MNRVKFYGIDGESKLDGMVNEPSMENVSYIDRCILWEYGCLSCNLVILFFAVVCFQKASFNSPHRYTSTSLWVDDAYTAYMFNLDSIRNKRSLGGFRKLEKSVSLPHQFAALLSE